MKTTGGLSGWRRAGLWSLPGIAIVALWLLQVFSSGGYLPRQWLLPGMAVATAVLVLFAFDAVPAPPSRLTLATLGILLGYVLWMGLSALWANSIGNVWEATGRALVYLLVLALALTLLQKAEARLWLRYALLAGAALLAAACLWRLSSSGLTELFTENRFSYPVRYPNNTAALFLILFWPTLWLSADPREHWGIRGPAMGAATTLLLLAFLTQSRGAFWAFALSLAAVLLLSPARLRTLVHFFVPLGLALAIYPALNRYWLEGPEAVGNGPVVQRLLPVVVAAILAGAVIALVDVRLQLRARTRLLLASLLVVALLGGGIAGLAAYGGGGVSPLETVVEQWRGLVNDFRGLSPEEQQGEDQADPSSRFLIPGGSGRWDLWRVAWLDFKAAPLLGEGAGNYIFTYTQLRLRDRYAREAHSLPLQTLADTGIVGFALLFGGLGLALVAVLVERLRGSTMVLKWRRPPPPAGGAPPGEPQTQAPPAAGRPDYSMAWIMALLTAVVYWLLHSAVDWLWEMPGVTLPALLCLALAVSESAERRKQRLKDTAAAPLTPPKPVPSHRLAAFRWAVAAVAAVALIALSLPYLSLRYQDMAARNAPEAALENTRTAATLAPAWSEPLLLQARLYQQAAERTDDPGARLDNLALALDAARRAVGRDPAGWIPLFRAATAAEALAQEVSTPREQEPAAPGAGVGSLAKSAADQALAATYRAMSVSELRDLARDYATEAQAWNPKAQNIATFLDDLSSS